MVEPSDNGLGNPEVRLCEIVRAGGSCGFNLTKNKWDPYPWVSTVDEDSPASLAGVQAGDCLLEVNGEDVLGLRVMEVANRMKARNDRVTVMLWNAGVHPTCTPEALCCGPMPTNLQRLSSCMTTILAALECPICLDTIPPPAHQCANGHLICVGCRVRTERCPVCRMKFFRGRSLLADQVFNSLIDAFELREEEESNRPKMLRRKLCGNQAEKRQNKPEIKINFLASPTNKFLTRIMGSGKSSSADNLSQSNHFASASNLSIPGEGDFYPGLKAKSLSSNEIFRAETQPLSRAASVLSSRPGSGLLDVALTQRPASYHGSSEDLHTRLSNDFGIEFKAGGGRECACPCDPSCAKQIPSTQVMKHVEESHDGPIVHFFRPNITLAFPVIYPASAVLAVASYGTVFIVNIKELDQGGKQIWLWTVSDESFRSVVSIKTGEYTMAFDCPVFSLSHVGWAEINPSRNVLLDKDFLRTLDNDNVTMEIEVFRDR